MADLHNPLALSAALTAKTNQLALGLEDGGADLLDLVTVAERRLASTRFDTRESPPVRPVPARPPRS